MHAVSLSRWQSLATAAARGPISRLPLQVLYYRSARFRRELERLLAGSSFDLVHVCLLRLAPYVAEARLPRVVDLIDSMRLNLEAYTSLERPPKRWILREEARRIAPFERRIVESFDRSIVVSERDRELLLASSVTVIPNGVDTELFTPGLGPRDEGPTVVFSGTMSYGPNVHAVEWFVEECLPRIQALTPGARLLVAGRGPTRRIRRLQHREGIEVTGAVDSIARVLNRAHVAVAPMRSGSGIQNKILEAMACGLPVVTTSLGLGGLDARSGDELLVVDEPDAFADAVAGMLGSLPQALEMGVRAREFVVANHTWARAADQVDEVYRSVLADRALN